MVHFKAKSMGLKGLKRSELPKFRDIWPKFYLLLPLVVLVYTVMQTGSFTMAYCAVVSSLVAIVASMMDREKGVGRKLLMLIPGIPLLIYAFGMPNLTVFFPNATSQELYAYRDLMTTWFLPIFFVLFIIFTLISEPNRKNVQTYVTALEGGTKSCLSVGVACGMAGIVAGVVTSTGLGQIIINAIVAVAGDQLIIALVLTMLCCIVLGMGVPTTANYVIMATTCAPILIQMGVPLMAAHFFVFYFGIVADITPPVALAAYAGSAIAKADPMKTGLNATRLAIAAFIVPYIFVFSPIMLFIGEYTVFDVVRIVVTSSCGMFLLGAGLIGFMLRKLNMVLRLVCIAAGLCMIDPGGLHGFDRRGGSGRYDCLSGDAQQEGGRTARLTAERPAQTFQTELRLLPLGRSRSFFLPRIALCGKIGYNETNSRLVVLDGRKFIQGGPRVCIRCWNCWNKTALNPPHSWLHRQAWPRQRWKRSEHVWRRTAPFWVTRPSSTGTG